MREITIYEKSTCSKCRVAISLVGSSGVPMRRVRYYDEPLTKGKLRELVRKLGVRPAEIVRRNEGLYKELGVDVDAMGDEEVIELLAIHPDLLQRPILEFGDRAIVGRKNEDVERFIELSANG